MGRVLWWLVRALLYVLPVNLPGRPSRTEWKNGGWYQAYLRSFRNGRGGKWGDIAGLIAKLDYIKSVCEKAILWIGPVCDSPQGDMGYDVRDYRRVDGNFGTDEDLDKLVKEAEKRGMKVVVDFVVNHVSEQHRWAVAALDPTHRWHWWYRWYFIWSRSGTRYPDAPNPFPDTPNWRPVEYPPRRRWWWPFTLSAPKVRYVMTTFYSFQLDLNYRNPVVVIAMLRELVRWARRVHGLRLDAARHIMKRRKTNCQGLMEAHVFLALLRRILDWVTPGRILIAEANEPPERMVKYQGTRRLPECHLAYDFAFMGGLMEASRTQVATPLRNAIAEVNAAYADLPPEDRPVAFANVHDDMNQEHDPVTRAAWQDAYPDRARHLGIVGRLHPLHAGGDDEAWKNLMVTIHLLGTSSLLYYGDEIGAGDDPRLPDRDGIRMLFPWEVYRYAGFSDTEEGLAYPGLIEGGRYDYRRHNAMLQEQDPRSLLNFTRRLLGPGGLCDRHRALISTARTDLLGCTDDRILCSARPGRVEALVVVRNSSWGDEVADTVDLRPWRGWKATDVGATLEGRPEEPSGVIPDSGVVPIELPPAGFKILYLIPAAG